MDYLGKRVVDHGRKLPFLNKSLYQIGKDLRPSIDRFIARNSLIPNTALVDTRYFPWIRMLERNWETIRDEALRIRAEDIPSLGEISREHGRIAGDRRWKSFFFEGYGYRREENRQRAPKTTALLDRIPGLVTASFSVLEAGCHIPRHVGMTKGTLVYHLGLSIPRNREACHINIETEAGLHVHSWSDGGSLLFDDTYNHEVWNDTDEDRYILLVQMQRPCRKAARRLLRFFLFCVRHSRFVQEIKKRLDRMPTGNDAAPAPGTPASVTPASGA
ncbi:hypothetical protein SSA02_19470 [Swaminathania salitolerans]|uniref:Aspartyl/asparaginy/proline hydroxylase domain-containing protein n=1 Tax=Swaminathania salitolerans TaxID=182838 RepID=A0A511BTA5_9PROT|nr:hypothetical protein SSA02_19470 [Swaminathania salitolerans]